MTRSRNAFTLIELLVVMSLMAVLATLAIAFFPGVASSAREARAATQLQGWLNIAKQRALRDQTPTGVRLLVDPTTLPLRRVVECQYIAQPEDYAVGRITTVEPAAPFVTVQINGSSVDLQNGYPAAADMQYWAVQPGDFLEVNGSGLVYRITAVATSGVQVTPPLPNRITTPCSYRIIRAPRVSGEESLKLPNNTIVDLDTNTAFAVTNPLPTNALGDIDIVFGPSGAVISRNIATDKIHLWVRSPAEDVAADNPFRGDPTLISIFVRTGVVGAYPPDKTSANPYNLVR